MHWIKPMESFYNDFLRFILLSQRGIFNHVEAEYLIVFFILKTHPFVLQKFRIDQ